MGTEFAKLVLRDEEVDLVRVALEIAADAWPDLSFDTTERWIAERRDELLATVTAAWSDVDQLHHLADCLAGTHGITGDAEAYDGPDGSYLHRVIETRRGIPISLSILYMGVAEQVSIDLSGVAVPGHFLTRYDSTEGPLFLDAYHGGRILTRRECLDWMSERTQRTSKQLAGALKPIGPRAITLRLLANLKLQYARKLDWEMAWHVQRRLVGLQPGSYEARRDLALLSVKANRPGEAVALLEDCITAGPETDTELLTEHLRGAWSKLARWN